MIEGGHATLKHYASSFVSHGYFMLILMFVLIFFFYVCMNLNFSCDSIED